MRRRRAAHTCAAQRPRRALAALVLFAFVACGSSSTKLGPMTFEPPKGWLVTDRSDTTLKVTNGTIAGDNATHAGTATAVFDIYLDSSQTPAQFRKVLRSNNVRPRTERIKVDGYDAQIVSYGSSYFGPSSEVLFIPAWKVQAAYRAAFPDDNAAYERNRPDFRAAIASIRFSGRPAGRA
jgi:hypothetical protein